jgi:hypothetical protein
MGFSFYLITTDTIVYCKIAASSIGYLLRDLVIVLLWGNTWRAQVEKIP